MWWKIIAQAVIWSIIRSVIAAVIMYVNQNAIQLS